MNIYMTYDNRGFDQAKLESDDNEFHDDQYQEIISYLVSWGGHDLLMGFCDSYQIYNQDGQIIIDSNSSSNSNEEVA